MNLDRRKPLRFVGSVECDQIGDLFAFEINHAQFLAFRKFKGRAGLWFQTINRASAGE